MLARCGRVAGSIFTTGPIMTRCQSGLRSATPATRSMSMRSSMTPKKPSRGCGIAAWSAGSGSRSAPRLREMVEVDRGREAVHVAVPVPLRLVEAHAAGEDDVGAPEQLGLVVDHLLRGAAEKRELVHVVVDAQIAFEMARERHRHRRVIPKDARRFRLAGEKAVDQAALPRGHVALAQALGQDRRRDGDAAGTFRHVHARPRALLEERLFDLQHAIMLGGAAQQMLRALPDEVPAKMGEADEQWGGSVGVAGCKRDGRTGRRTLFHGPSLR